GGQHPEQDPHRRGLARTVRWDEPGHPAVADGEAQVVQHLLVTEASIGVLEGDHASTLGADQGRGISLAGDLSTRCAGERIGGEHPAGPVQSVSSRRPIVAMPCSYAQIAAWMRARRSSFVSRFDTWVLTVASPTKSRPAISALLAPVATSSSTSISR